MVHNSQSLLQDPDVSFRVSFIGGKRHRLAKGRKNNRQAQAKPNALLQQQALLDINRSSTSQKSTLGGTTRGIVLRAIRRC